MPVVRRIRGGRNFVASLGSILEAGEAAVSGKVSFISSTDYFRREYPRGSWKRTCRPATGSSTSWQKNQRKTFGSALLTAVAR
jgi:hypothetical protein